MEKQAASCREFSTRSSMVAAGITHSRRALGAMPLPLPAMDCRKQKDKTRMGLVGIGNRGTQLPHAFMNNYDLEIAALCGICEPYLARDNYKVQPEYLKLGGSIPKLRVKFGNKAKQHHNFRDMLADEHVDAVCNAGWNAGMPARSCQPLRPVKMYM